MMTRVTIDAARRAPRVAFVSGFLLTLLGVPAGRAAPPIEPLPAPAFSFDLGSPSVENGLFFAADILSMADTVPDVVIPGPGLQLLSPFDDLDALSGNKAQSTPAGPFQLLFSVDRATVGIAAPDPDFVLLGVPFNVADQAARGQAAGDQYASSMLFVRGGTARAAARGLNSVLVRNNYDEGGTDFGAVPAVDAYGNAARGLQDNVDATAYLQRTGPTQAILNVFFSLSEGSPSLTTLPHGGPPSGATIYINPDPLNMGVSSVYAEFYQLGLTPLDDIDALLVLDMNMNGIYDGPDSVLFSLTPESPSLQTIMGASIEGAGADVFTVAPGLAPAVFAPASAFGLGAPLDNIDALELVPCDNSLACGQLHGIRALRGDLNCDNAVNFRDINPFVLALSNPAAYHANFPGCFIMNGDINLSGTVDFADINPFVMLLSTGGDGH